MQKQGKINKESRTPGLLLVSNPDLKSHRKDSKAPRRRENDAECYLNNIQNKSKRKGAGGSVVELRTPEREVQGLKPMTAVCVHEQDTLRFPKYW